MADSMMPSRVSFVVDAGDADAIGDEAVWKDGTVVGWITSGAYGHHCDASIAIGYVPTETLANGEAWANGRSKSWANGGRQSCSWSRCLIRRRSGCGGSPQLP